MFAMIYLLGATSGWLKLPKVERGLRRTAHAGQIFLNGERRSQHPIVLVPIAVPGSYCRSGTAGPSGRGCWSSRLGAATTSENRLSFRRNPHTPQKRLGLSSGWRLQRQPMALRTLTVASTPYANRGVHQWRRECKGPCFRAWHAPRRFSFVTPQNESGAHHGARRARLAPRSMGERIGPQLDMNGPGL
jgi:hypothetical protein